MLAGEQHETLEPAAVDAEARVVGVAQGDGSGRPGGDEAPFDQRLAVGVLDAQEDVGAGSAVVAQVHFERLEIRLRPVVSRVFAAHVGVVRLAQHARAARGAEVESQREGPLVAQPHVDGGGVAPDVVGVAVLRQGVVLEIADAHAFAGEAHVEQHAPQPANVLRHPALVGAEFPLPLAQLPLVQVGLQRPLVEEIAGRDLDDHENDERQAQQQRDGDEQPLHDVGQHGGIPELPPGRRAASARTGSARRTGRRASASRFRIPGAPP